MCNDIKNIIKSHRLAAGLTMKELADKVGVSEATISRWESGNIATMKQSKIASICKALNISPALFVPGATTPKPSPSYYVDPETAELADRLKNQPGMRMLFDASRKASPKDLEIAANLLKQLKGEE